MTLHICTLTNLCVKGEENIELLSEQIQKLEFRYLSLFGYIVAYSFRRGSSLNDRFA